MITIYVAGSSAEPERVRMAMEAVKALPGCTLALDWLAPIEGGKSANAGLDHAERRYHAEEDLRAIRGSDALWFLAPRTPTRGAWVELGYALCHLPSTRAAIVCSGPIEQSIFLALCTEVSTDAEALDYLRGLAIEWRRECP